jgi:drug/metabolite transporter (DMT)-like permease
MTDRRPIPRAEIQVAGSVLLATAGQLAIKLGLRKAPGLWTWTPHPLHAPFTAGVLGGLLIYGMGTLLWMSAISKRNISHLYPLASLNHILIALCGHLLLHESLLPGRWIGIGIMAAGILLLMLVVPRSELA